MRNSIRRNDGFWLNTDVFREEAIRFKKNKYYCEHPKGTLDYNNYWDEQLRRCMEGYVVAGEKITGDHYFYLNFCNIGLIDVLDDDENSGTVKKNDFPSFWDYDYEYFWWLHIARFGVLGKYSQARELLTKAEISAVDGKKMSSEELASLKEDVVYNRLKLRLRTHPDYLNGGHHFMVAKSRRKGFTYKNTALSVNTYNTVRNSQCVLGVCDKKYSNEGMKFIDNYLGLLNDNTAWGKRREVKDRADWKRASYIEINSEGKPVEKGYKSEIVVVSFQDNPEAANGKSPYYMLFEEAGIFTNLKKSWDATKPALQAGKFTVGQSIFFGCVCAGTKVWTRDGRLVNIENLRQEDGIIGYGGGGISKETISYMQERKKKPCYRITTINGSVIECSDDHPILSRKSNDSIYSIRRYVKGKRVRMESYPRIDWITAKDIKKGYGIVIPREVPLFGNIHNEHARLIGLLIGDGSYGKDKTPVLSNCDYDINEYVYSNYDCVTEKECETLSGEKYKETRIRRVCGILRDAGIYGQTKDKKTLPIDFDRYDKESFCELIGGLFDTDGYFYVNNGKVRINLSQAYKPILDSLKLMLVKIGVHCNISYIRPYERNHDKKDVNGYYRLQIDDNRSVFNFKNNIRLLSKRKQKVLDRCMELNGGSRNSDMYVRIDYDSKSKNVTINKYANVCIERVESVEYIGEQYIYNLTADVTHTYLANNIITHNTGGVTSDNNGEFSEMFYDPTTYNIMPFKNQWDDGCSEDYCGFFFSAAWNLEGFYDKMGNTDENAAIEYLNNERRKLLENAHTIDAYNGYVIQFPICPKESFKSTSRSVFNVALLEKQLSAVRAGNLQFKKGTCVKLTMVSDDKVEAKPILNGSADPIIEYKFKNKDLRGCPIIYEYPVENAPRGLYKIGYDPYAKDKSTGDSLGAIYVYKGILRGDYSRNIIVAEYVGRPETAEEMDEIALKFAILYNTEVMFESNVEHTRKYFQRRHRLDRLCVQPEKVVSYNIKKSKSSYKFGCHLDGNMKAAGEEYVKEYLKTVLDYDENGDPVTPVNYIYSIGLLEELIKYHRDGNFDRVCALFQIMFQLQDEELEQEYGEEHTNSRIDELLKLNLFKRKRL